MKKIGFLFAFLLIVLSFGYAQNKFNGPVSPNQKMPQFVLPTYQGTNFDMESYKGKNVVLFFIRGLVEKIIGAISVIIAMCSLWIMKTKCS